MEKNFRLLFCLLGGILLNLIPLFSGSVMIVLSDLKSGLPFMIISVIVAIISFIGLMVILICSILLIKNNTNFSKKN
ncbi:hypothetical protein [Clostridium uliginosum]|uniref:Uncharacterized protein n=1 Tax=Clostridium uliginosum TaxID=119641 RepID=A0A1I1PX35_9CLOT|nr:hypothetical protein [Clostridium uliginosum]SFD14471.1 hypothetical protein SAMN05421842_12152 [Clostridium uliginosum]